ncbi:MAG: FecR domain-containing protein [Rhodospirillales bacterium]
MHDPSNHPGNSETSGRTHMDDALDWFTRLQSGGAALADREAFTAWLRADPAHAEAYRRVEDVWGSPAFKGALTRHASADADVMNPVPGRRRLRIKKFAAVATALAVVLVSALKGPDLVIALEADAAAGIGERSTSKLADGSQMTLNTASAADIDFSADLRRVTLLRGEAYFDVSPDAARPFEVIAGDARVRVVGTAFTVRRTGQEVRVTVARGRVAVTGAVTDKSVELSPGDGVVAAAGQTGDVERTNTDQALAWIDGRLRFRERPLGEVLAELDRYHTGYIGAASGRARTTVVSGNYRLDDPAAVARALASAASLDAIDVGGFVLVLR